MAGMPKHEEFPIGWQGQGVEPHRCAATPGSPSAMATVTQNLTEELICIVQGTLIVTRQYQKFLQVMMAKWQEAVCSGTHTTHTTTPQLSPSPPPGKRSSRKEEQLYPGLLEPRGFPQGLRVELLGADAHMEKMADGDKDQGEDTGPSRSSPAQVGRRSPMGMRKRSPMTPDRISSMGLGSTIHVGPGSSTPADPSPRHHIPVGRARGQAASGPCWAGLCLQEGCSRLWGCPKAWWRCHCRLHCVRFCEPPRWQRCSHKSNGFPCQ